MLCAALVCKDNQLTKLFPLQNVLLPKKERTENKIEEMNNKNPAWIEMINYI